MFRAFGWILVGLVLGVHNAFAFDPAPVVKSDEETPYEYSFPEGKRPPIIHVGDIHGDLPAYLAILKHAGVLNEDGQIINYNCIIAQQGDLIDGAAASPEVMYFQKWLEDQMQAHGGLAFSVQGNHEIYNLFDGDSHMQAAEKRLYSIGLMHNEKNRKDQVKLVRALFKRDHKLRDWFLRRNVFMKVDNQLFVHAGPTAEMLASDSTAIPKGAISKDLVSRIVNQLTGSESNEPAKVNVGHAPAPEGIPSLLTDYYPLVQNWDTAISSELKLLRFPSGKDGKLSYGITLPDGRVISVWEGGYEVRSAQGLKIEADDEISKYLNKADLIREGYSKVTPLEKKVLDRLPLGGGRRLNCIIDQLKEAAKGAAERARKMGIPLEGH